MEWKGLAISGLLAASACAPADDAALSCPFPAEDAAWIQPAVVGWAAAMERSFSVKIDAPPQMIVLGANCAWAAGRDADAALGSDGAKTATSIVFHGADYPVYAAPLDGEFLAPNGQSIAPGPLAFTSPAADSGRPFFMVAAAEIWRSVLPSERFPDVAAFLEGVAVHELVHTEHAPIMAHLEEAIAEDPELADVSDDWIYDRFRDAPDYADSIAREKALLIAALQSADREERRRMARRVVKTYRDRQRAYFGARYDLFRDMEDTFLTMEGVAVWLSFQVAPPNGAADGGAQAVAGYYEAGGGGSWVQAEGGMMAALLESLSPAWRAQVFAPGWARLPELLEAAAKAPA